MNDIDRLRKWLTEPFLADDPLQDEVARQCVRAQQEYCDRNGLPQFAPYDGMCWHYGRNIYDGGIGIDEAGGRLITACPFCHRTFTE